MIPPLDKATGLLPFQGEEPYWVDLSEVRERFVTDDHRRRLWHAAELWLDELDAVGFPGSLRIAGGFVTARTPTDIDIGVAVPASAMSEASAMVRRTAHLWTWQAVHTLQGGDYTFVADRVQPVLGRVDAHFFRDHGRHGEIYARDWTSVYEGGEPSGSRKGWLGVRR